MEFILTPVFLFLSLVGIMTGMPVGFLIYKKKNKPAAIGCFLGGLTGFIVGSMATILLYLFL